MHHACYETAVSQGGVLLMVIESGLAHQSSELADPCCSSADLDKVTRHSTGGRYGRRVRRTPIFQSSRLLNPDMILERSLA